MGRLESDFCNCLRVAVIIGIFRVSAYGNRRAGREARVDGIDGAERVHHDLVARQSSIAAWLESGRITGEGGIKIVNRSQNHICVFGRSAVVDVDIGERIPAGRGPKGL